MKYDICSDNMWYVYNTYSKLFFKLTDNIKELKYPESDKLFDKRSIVIHHLKRIEKMYLYYLHPASINPVLKMNGIKINPVDLKLF